MFRHLEKRALVLALSSLTCLFVSSFSPRLLAVTVDVDGVSWPTLGTGLGLAEVVTSETVGNFAFHLEFSHVDEQLNDYIFTPTVIDEQDLFDAHIGWTSNSGEWQVSLWGKNLTDEAYFSHTYVIGPGAIGVWGPPRTYGITATWFMQ